MEEQSKIRQNDLKDYMWVLKNGDYYVTTRKNIYTQAM